MLKQIEDIGNSTINTFLSIYEAILFALTTLLHIFNPKSYNPAMIMVLVKQIYFTAIGILPVFIFMAIFFGSGIMGVIVSLSINYNLQDKIGSIIATFTIDEFSPFFTALLISLRSSTAVNTEIAVMKVNKELNTLKKYKIDLINYLFVPRIISGIVSVTSLSALFAIIMISSGFIFSFFYMGIDFWTYIKLIFEAIDISDISILLIKGIAFGFVTMVIPIYSGLNAFDSYTAIPISVLNGMVKLFISIFFIEVLSLVLQLT